MQLRASSLVNVRVCLYVCVCVRGREIDKREKDKEKKEGKKAEKKNKEHGKNSASHV